MRSPGESTNSDRVVNLTVHGIGPIAREFEPGEDRTWVTVEQFELVLQAVRDRPDVRITLDDGNASDVEIALPRLLEHGLTAQFFILAGRLGEPGRLTVDGVHELQRAGMSVGSHGWAHRDWRRITAAEAPEEYATAPRRISELTGQPCTTVAIPFGSYDRHVLHALRREGVTRVYTSDGGPARADAWLQPRNSLLNDLDRGWIERVLVAPPSVRARARRVGARVVKRYRGRP